jgi:hypothetical protein
MMEMVHHQDVTVELSRHMLASQRKIETLRFQLWNSDTTIQGCRSGFVTLPSEPLRQQPAMVLLWGRPLASWLFAPGERGGHDDLHGSGLLSVTPYVYGRTELYCAQACLT